MPKISPGIPNELLLAHFDDRGKLSDGLWIIAPQVSMLLGRSVDQLDEDRKIGKPPPAMKPWGTKGAVRYKLGTVRDFMCGTASEEYNNAEHARQGIAKRDLMGLTCFDDFLANGRAQDVWPITIHLGTPIDFFRSLGLGDALTDTDTCEWMTLDGYLELRRSAAWAHDVGLLDCPVSSESRGTRSAETLPGRADVSEAELVTLASFFAGGTAISSKIFVAGDPPFPCRGAFILRLVQKAAEHLGFEAGTSAQLVEMGAYSRVHLSPSAMIGPFHELLAMHSPSQYLWYCEKWTGRLQRIVLGAAKSHIANDAIGLTMGTESIDGPVRARTRIGILVEALAYKVSSFDTALVTEVFPGLNQAVELIYDNSSRRSFELTESQLCVEIDKMKLLYSFLKEGEPPFLEVPPL